LDVIVEAGYVGAVFIEDSLGILEAEIFAKRYILTHHSGTPGNIKQRAGAYKWI
jgi:hypothetical protein